MENEEKKELDESIVFGITEEEIKEIEAIEVIKEDEKDVSSESE